MPFARLPVLVRFDEKRLREQLDARVGRDRTALISLPFDDLGRRALEVDRQLYRRLEPEAIGLLAYIAQKIEREPDQGLKHALWQRVVVERRAAHYATEHWRALLIRWALTRPPTEYLEGKLDLAEAFLRHALGLRDQVVVTVEAAALRRRCDPSDTRGGLIEAAFALELERHHDELFREYAPRVVLAAVNLFPATRLPLVIGAAIQALAGFVEFMLFLQDAESDGAISAEELEEARWNRLGILPFDLVQKMLLLRGLGVAGLAVLELLIHELRGLLDRIENHAAAAEAGWGGYVQFDREAAIVLPRYALDETP